MSLDSLFPHAGNHSIQNAILAVEWGGELSVGQLETLRTTVSPLLAGAREEVQQQIRMSLTPGMGQTPVQAAEVGGYVYSLFSPAAELQKQIQVNRANCLIIVSDYLRWSDLISEAEALLGAIFLHFVDSVSIAAVGLQYSDRFVWKAKPEDLNLKEVFRADSTFLSSHGLECRSAWHSHHGYFISCGTPISHKRLDNINVNVVDEPDGRAIQILTSHRAVLDSAIPTKNAINTVVDLENELHGVNKSIIKDLLSDQLLAKIKLSEDKLQA